MPRRKRLPKGLMKEIEEVIKRLEASGGCLIAATYIYQDQGRDTSKIGKAVQAREGLLEALKEIS